MLCFLEVSLGGWVDIAFSEERRACLSNLPNAESILRAVTQIFVLSANDLYNREKLTRSWTGTGKHQGAGEHRLRQVMDKDSSHLSLSFQICSQPGGHPWLIGALTDQPSSAMWPWPYDPYPCWEQLSMAVHSCRTPLKHIWSQSKESCIVRVSCSPSAGFTSAVPKTSSTQPYTTSLMSPEKWRSAPYLSLHKAGIRGKWPSLQPQANCSLAALWGSESHHPHSLLEKAAETETYSLDNYT